MAETLPERPNPEQLRKLARDRQRETGVPLHAAQLDLARRYGFASWPRLAAHVAALAERTWTPPPATPDEPVGDRAVRLGCLTWSEAPFEPEAAADLARRAADESDTDLALAAATADAERLRAEMARGADPDAPCGPFGWPALMYLTYSRIPAGPGETLAAARVLLDAGTEPNAGRYFAGFPTPFTALTGIFGGGEADSPPHPHETALAELLLDAGADPNDAQTLYNRQFDTDDSFLRVLLAHGLGTGDGGPWRRRLPDLTPSPVDLVRSLLAWAVIHDQRDRVGLLAAHGVDLATPLPGSDLPGEARTPHAAALLNGHRVLAAQLRAAGAPAATLTDAERAIEALLAGDRTTVAALPAVVLAEARSARPGLVVWAAAAGHGEAVDLLVEHGWDVNALGRGDVPREQPWQTALHTAVERDDADLVRRLLALGADASIRDARFGGDAAGWARHFGHERLLPLLGAARSGGDVPTA